MTIEKEKQRWQYRFANFKRAYFLLREANDLNGGDKLDQLDKEGMVHRFEYCTELAWKTVKNYLESQNVVFAQITPRAVIKEAVAAKLIERGEEWMNLLDARNEMSHTYNFKKFEEVIKQIDEKYIVCFGELYEKLAEEDIHANGS